MKRFVVVAMLVVGALSAWSFDDYGAGSTAYVTLKNGKKMQGTMLSYVPGDSLVLLTHKGDTVTYKLAEVEQVKRRRNPNMAFTREFGQYGPRKGYRGAFEVGLITAAGSLWTLSTVHGYQFSPWLFAGAGVELFRCRFKSTNKEESDKVEFHPAIFGDLRLDLTRYKISPYIDFRIGDYVLDGSHLYLSPSIGTRFTLDKNNRLAANLELGYLYLNPLNDPDERVSNIIFRMGLEF